MFGNKRKLAYLLERIENLEHRVRDLEEANLIDVPRSCRYLIGATILRTTPPMRVRDAVVQLLDKNKLEPRYVSSTPEKHELVSTEKKK